MRTLAVLALLSFPAYTQVPLTEELAPGTTFRTELMLELKGAMKFERNNRIEDAPLESTGKHIYLERFDSGAKSYRHYLEANSATTVGVERGERTLAKDKRLFLVNRTKEGTSPCMLGPLTREELSLVAEHFDALRIPELLPGKAVTVGESWPIRDEVAAGLCLFDAITKNELIGKLLEVKDNAAHFSIAGKVEGLEHGAKAKISIAAKGEFDLAAKRVTKLTWEQSDLREQGPVSPALEAKVKVIVARSVESGSPREFSSEALEAVEPKAAKKSPTTHLIFHHPEKKYEFVYGRDWHTVVQSETHLVLRLVVRGEMIAQVTIAPWKTANFERVELNRKDFLDAVAKQPGWSMDKGIWSGAVKTFNDNEVYRIVEDGKQDGVAVVQSFHLITGKDGRQAVLTCVVRPELAEKLGTADAELAGRIGFPPAK